MFYPGFFDSTILILIPATIIAFIAQINITSNYKKYSKISILSGINGAQVARSILDGAGLYDVKIEVTNRELGDHYDPSSRVVRLSKDVYYGINVAASGIAAHECGHAIQHQINYVPLVLRTKIARAVGVGSNLSVYLFMIGIIFSIPLFAKFGIIFFGATVIYQLITLPVEFDASKRALEILNTRLFLNKEELYGARKVLNSAAMTYVAATLMAISQLIRLIAINNRYNDN